MRSVVVTFGPEARGLPWWWEEIQADTGLCPLSHIRATFRNKRSKEISTLELPFVFAKVLFLYLRLRNKYDYIYTFECDLTSFALSFWQTLLRSRKPRHVIIQFIMREKTPGLWSRIKYQLMKWCFSSVYKAICSATVEAEYYKDAFNWPTSKFVFSPFHSSSRFLQEGLVHDDEYLISAGRIFRDFGTLVSAVQQSDYKTVIIAPRDTVRVGDGHDHIKVLEDIPLTEYDSLMARARIVVLSLKDRKISAGQTVLLDAMALGKAIIATRTAATIDYIRDDENGLFVEPGNPLALRKAIDLLMADSDLRKRLGRTARQDVIEHYLPHHYTRRIRELVY